MCVPVCVQFLPAPHRASADAARVDALWAGLATEGVQGPARLPGALSEAQHRGCSAGDRRRPLAHTHVLTCTQAPTRGVPPRSPSAPRCPRGWPRGPGSPPPSQHSEGGQRPHGHSGPPSPDTARQNQNRTSTCVRARERNPCWQGTAALRSQGSRGRRAAVSPLGTWFCGGQRGASRCEGERRPLSWKKSGHRYSFSFPEATFETVFGLL